MSIDNELRDALRARANDVTQDPNALTAIGTGVVRARRRRAALASVAAIVVLTGGGLVASSLLTTENPGGFVAPGEGSPAPSSTHVSAAVRLDNLVPLPAGYNSHYFDRRGYYVAYPEDFDRAEWEGSVEIRLPGMPSLASGQPTWAVAIVITGGTQAPVDCQGTPGTATINGEQVHTCDRPDDRFERWHVFTWPDAPCNHPELICDTRSAGLTVVARIVASNQELWDQHLDHGETIVSTIRQGLSDPHGFRSTEEARNVLHRFMEARIDSDHPERYATPNAMRYVEMFGHGSAAIDYVGFDILQPVADGDTIRYNVDVRSEDGTISHELIEVGAEEGIIKVRDVRLVSRESA